MKIIYLLWSIILLCHIPNNINHMINNFKSGNTKYTQPEANQTKKNVYNCNITKRIIKNLLKLKNN